MTASLDRAVEAALRDVLDRLEEATRGEWKAVEGPVPAQHWETAFCGGGDEHDVRVVCFQQDYCTHAMDDAAAIAGAVNFLRDYGPQLLAALPHLGVDREALRSIAQEMTDYVEQEVDPELDVVDRWRTRILTLIDAKQE